MEEGNGMMELKDGENGRGGNFLCVCRFCFNGSYGDCRKSGLYIRDCGGIGRVLGEDVKLIVSKAVPRDVALYRVLRV